MSQSIFSDFIFFAQSPEPRNYKISLSESMEDNFLALKERVDRKSKAILYLSKIAYNSFCDFVSGLDLAVFNNGENFYYVEITEFLVARFEFLLWPGSMVVQNIFLQPLIPDGTPPGGVGKALSVGSLNLSVRSDENRRRYIQPPTGLRCSSGFEHKTSMSIQDYLVGDLNSSELAVLLCAILSNTEVSSLRVYDEGWSNYCGNSTHDAFERYHSNVESSDLSGRDVEKMKSAYSQIDSAVPGEGALSEREATRSRKPHKGARLRHQRAWAPTSGVHGDNELR